MVESRDIYLLCDDTDFVRDSTTNNKLLAFSPSLDLCAQRHVPTICNVVDREPAYRTVVLGHAAVATDRNGNFHHSDVSFREKLWGDRGESEHQNRRPIRYCASSPIPG